MMNPQTPGENFSFLRGAFEQLDKRVGSLENTLGALRQEMERGFDRVDDRFNAVDKKFDSLANIMQLLIRWWVGSTAVVGATLLAAIILRLH